MKITEQEVVEDIKKMFDTGRFEFPVTEITSAYCGSNNAADVRIHLMRDEIDLSTMVRVINFYLEKKNKDKEGDVVVTTNEDGECVLVSRQDEDHKILKVIWEKK